MGASSQPGDGRRKAAPRRSFLVGWVLGLAAVAAIAYTIADASDAATNTTASDSVSWGTIGLGVVLLALAR